MDSTLFPAAVASITLFNVIWKGTALEIFREGRLFLLSNYTFLNSQKTKHSTLVAG